MSIRRRVEDALALHDLCRFDGALLCALVAAAATARKEEPSKKVSERACFESFLAKGAARMIVGVEFRGELHSIPHIFYKWLRCELVHEGGIPMDIEFVGDIGSKQLSLRAGGAPHYVLQLSHGWFFEILRLVKTASVNRDEFKDGA
jgi:hypothetical protein